MNARPRAIVTGGARRVGRATCLEFARAGCDVHFTYLSGEAEAEALLQELRSLGAEAQASRLDLDDLAEVERFAANAALGRVDILVNNASIYAPSAALAAQLDLPPPSAPAAPGSTLADEILRFYRVNAAAPMLLSVGCASSLARSELPGGGAIVALCDIHAMGRPRRGFLPYTASKAALAEMVASLAVDLAPRVRVNGLAPGVVAFPDAGYESDAEMQDRYLRRVPLARPGTPEEAAAAIRWLALDAHYVTGEILRIDGGRWLT